MKQDTKKETVIILELTEQEQKALNTVLLGHGNGKKAANKTRIHRLTLRRIAITGRGYKKNIQKIRLKLLEPIGIKENNAEIRQDTGLGNQANITNNMQKAS